MAKTTFKRKPNTAKEETTETSTEVAVPETSDMGAYNSPGGSGWETTDIRIPYLSLVQKTGSMADAFDKGSFVFNKELQISDGKEPVEITILRADKYFVEDIEFDPDIRPKKFNTRDEFLAEGFSLDYEAEMKVKEAAELVVLLPVDEEYSTFSHDGGAFVRAAWICQSSAYATVGRTVATAMIAGHLRDGVHKGKWALTSEMRSNKKASWYVPIIRSLGRHDKDFLSFVEEQAIV